jgi:hypothetical protein
VRKIKQLIKIKELIDILQEFDPELGVVIAENEGNTFSPLNSTGTGIFVQTTLLFGEYYNEDEYD